MRLDFPRLDNHMDQIVMRPGDDAWGPYEFDVSGSMPSGTALSEAEATAYLEDSDEYTEQESLIESGSVSVVGDDKVQLKLQANGLSAGTYYLKLTITLDSGGVKNLLFGPVFVESLT